MEKVLTRPTWDDQMRKDLAKVIAKKLVNMNSNPYDDEYTEEICYKCLRNKDDSAFELCKEFDDNGYNVDMELMEIMDGAFYESHEIRKGYTKKWVAENNICPTLSVGDFATIEVHGKKSGKYKGEIVDIRTETAEYGVCVEELGQVKGKSCYIIAYEKIIPDCGIAININSNKG